MNRYLLPTFSDEIQQFVGTIPSRVIELDIQKQKKKIEYQRPAEIHSHAQRYGVIGCEMAQVCIFVTM